MPTCCGSTGSTQGESLHGDVSSSLLTQIRSSKRQLWDKMNEWGLRTYHKEIKQETHQATACASPDPLQSIHSKTEIWIDKSLRDYPFSAWLRGSDRNLSEEKFSVSLSCVKAPMITRFKGILDWSTRIDFYQMLLQDYSKTVSMTQEAIGKCSDLLMPFSLCFDVFLLIIELILWMRYMWNRVLFWKWKCGSREERFFWTESCLSVLKTGKVHQDGAATVLSMVAPSLRQVGAEDILDTLGRLWKSCTDWESPQHSTG